VGFCARYADYRVAIRFEGPAEPGEREIEREIEREREREREREKELRLLHNVLASAAHA